MGTTELRKNGCHPDKLTDKQRHFVLAYCIHHDGKRAALEAGYSESSAKVTACRMLKTRNVKAMIGKIEGEQAKRFEIQRDEILIHLHACATRDAKDLVDEKGWLLVDNINDLPDEITRSIDGIEQDKITRVDKDGSTTTRRKTKIKMVPKNPAMKMCMDHKGLNAAVEVNQTIKLDFDSLIAPKGDPIESQILDVESRAIDNNGHKSNGNGKPKGAE